VDARARFDEIAADLEVSNPDVQLGQMMGHPCIKASGKIIASFQTEKDSIAFKLPDEAERAKTLALEGAVPFEPMGKGKVMKEWVEVPVAHGVKWAELADTALRLRRENP
jgi:hypothetical protein